jgi:phosphoribosylaminoimidazolecarboxamide formyltransferase/IMP cyclohydrolase
MSKCLVSVSDKRGVEEMCSALVKCGVSLVASGGTCDALRKHGLTVESVESLTNSPEFLGGRVKTLHPAVHGAILAKGTLSDLKELSERGYSKIDFVVCNLYPFEKCVSNPSATVKDAVEEVDIGGVTLLRAAAKNHNRVTVISNPDDYPKFIAEINASFAKDGIATVSPETRQSFALKAFTHTANYDLAISQYFRKEYAGFGNQQLALRYLVVLISDMVRTLIKNLPRCITNMENYLSKVFI